MLNTGVSAPDFEIIGTDGDEIRQYSLADLTESGAAVLLFYPFDFSPVCTAELCEFRDSEWLTVTPELDVVGISTDSTYSHRVFIERNDLPFPLLSDHDGSVSDAYDVLEDELEEHPQVSSRAVFLVDEELTIRYAWEAEVYTDDPDIDAVNEAAQELSAVGL
jgi:peroxiredoxin